MARPVVSIVGCYTLDLYCVGPVGFRECGEITFPDNGAKLEFAHVQITGATASGCRAQAREMGWSLERGAWGFDIARCPTCASK